MRKINFILLLIFINQLSYGQSNIKSDIELLLVNDKNDEVIKLVNELLDEKQDADIMYYLSVAYRENFQFEKSLEVCKNAVEKYGNLEQFRKIEAKNYISLNNDVPAIKIYEELYAQDSSNIQLKVQLARLYQSNKKYNEAACLYVDLVELDSVNSYYNKQLGLSLLELNIFDGIIYLENALTINPSDISVAIKLANFYNDKRAYLNANASLSFCIEHNTNSYQLHKLKGYTLFLLRDNENAIKSFEKVLQLGDSTKFTYKYLGYSYYELENYEKSYATLNEALKKDSTDSRVFYHLSISARKLYKTEESLAYMDKAMQLLYPSDATLSLYYMQLAEAYIVHGSRCKIKDKLQDENESYMMAIENFLISFDKDTSNTHALYQVAYTYDSYLSEKTKALIYYNDYKRNVQKYPDESDDQYAARLQFVNDKIQKIREDLHFDDLLED